MLNSFFLTRFPFFLELFVSGFYILLYSLFWAKKLPHNFSGQLVTYLLNAGAWLIPLVILLSLIINSTRVARADDFLRKHVFSILVSGALFITWGDWEFAYWLSSVHLLSSFLGLYDWDHNHATVLKEESALGFLHKYQFTPAQIVVFSFLGLIAVGTFLLMLPVSTHKGTTGVEWIDAFFVITSAACVTGLTTISIHDQLSLFGQIVVLCIIQVGGLGIMTLSSSLTLFLGKSINLKDRVVMQDLLDVSTSSEFFDLLVDIIKYTFYIELWGGVLLTIGFAMDGFELGKAIYYGFYHSISAFCNAGFSLFNNSLESFSNRPLIHGTIALLVTFGGIGFVVLKDMMIVVRREKKITQLHVHSKIVLLVSASLTFTGAVLIFFGEFLNAFDGYSLWEKIQISLFQSVTLRTAGFNTIPLGNLGSYTVYMMILLMFIGASPGSTGGGIKTSTLAILIQSIKTTLKGRQNVEIFKHRVPQSLIVRATALTILSLMMVAFFLFLLLIFEKKQSFLTLFFETVSAFGTVGLSLGITPYLTAMGKFLIICVMFVGRIGPLTLVLAVGQRRQLSTQYQYPECRIMIG